MGSLPRRPIRGTQPGQCKTASTYLGSAATHEGCGARCLHAARQPTPAPLRHAPLFTSDKLPVYIAALIANYSTPEPPAQRWRARPRRTAPSVGCEITTLRWTNDVRRRGRGPPPHHLRGATLSPRCLGQQINTAYVERDNLTSRQTNGRLVRKTLSHSKKSYFLRRHLDLEDAVFHFVRPYQALRIAVSQPTPGANGSNEAQRWPQGSQTISESRRTTFVSRPSSQGLKPFSRLRGTAPKIRASMINGPDKIRRR